MRATLLAICLLCCACSASPANPSPSVPPSLSAQVSLSPTLAALTASPTAAPTATPKVTATPTPRAMLTATPKPTPTATPKPSGPLKRRETVLVATPEGGLVSLTADLYKRNHGCGWYQASPSGYGFTTVVVLYESVAGTVSYNPYDWALHDEGQTQYAPSWTPCFSPELGTGFLGPGMNTGGAITFEVPRRAKHMWLDYRSPLGEVLASWRLW